MTGADVSLIGGSPDERLQYAIRLRRMGFSTFSEFKNRKWARMRKKAIDECRWGEGGVYNLEDAEDRAWLDRDDLAQVGV